MALSWQIASGLGLYYERIAVLLGFVTLVACLAAFTSCRSFAALVSRYAHTSLLENRVYQSFYKYHGYYWWSFLIMLILHMMSSAIHTALLPRAGDPDALEHWLILGFALGTLVALFVQVTSCRSFAGLIEFFSQRSPQRFRAYKGFYQCHAYYWWIVFVAVGGHVIASAIHTHVWPG